MGPCDWSSNVAWVEYKRICNKCLCRVPTVVTHGDGVRAGEAKTHKNG